MTTDVMDGGVYHPVVHFGEDVSLPLPGDMAVQYAFAFITMAQNAAYDAAIYNQWVFGFKLPKPNLAAAMVLQDIQPDRAPVTGIPDMVKAEPEMRIHSKTGRAKGFVFFTEPAVMAGTVWDHETCFAHAQEVLAVRAVSDLDTAYAKMTIRTLNIDSQRARFLAYDLGLWLESPGPEETALRLARDMREAGVPDEIVDKARDGVYGDFTSGLPAPEAQLYDDLRAAGRADLVERMIAGEWDASPAEAQQWMNSAAGQQLIADLSQGGITRPTPNARPKPKARKPRHKKRRR